MIPGFPPTYKIASAVPDRRRAVWINVVKRTLKTIFSDARFLT
jgi:hypothetical protein